MSVDVEHQPHAERHVLPDLVRAFALVGICLVNVAYVAWPGTLTYHAGGLDGVADRAAYFGVNALFLLKSYTLFAFMFGAGLAYQMLSSDRRQVSFGPEYFRRMLGLLVLGILHVSFAFFGDILILYALLGCLLFLFRHRSARALAWIGGALVVVQIVIASLLAAMLWLGETFDPAGMEEMAAELARESLATVSTFQSAGFAGTIVARWTEWLGYMTFGLLLQGPGVFGCFLLGLAAVKAGLVADPRQPFWRRGRRVGLPLGLLVSTAGAFVYAQADTGVSATALAGIALIVLGAPLSSWGYVGVLAVWAQRAASPLRRFLARAGSASLSAYLLQSLLLSLVFASYGLGVYGRLGAAACVGIAVAVAVLSLVAAGLWRSRFARGPVEMALRAWTYRGRADRQPATGIAA